MSEILRLSRTALDRFSVVSAILGRAAAGLPLAAAIAATLEVCRRLGPPRRPPSERTAYRWLRAFEAGGVPALEPKPRPRATSSKALGVDLERYLVERKRLDPVISIPEVLRLARLTGVVGPRAKVSRTTLWRAARRHDLPLERAESPRDMRSFEYPNRMLMALADGAHFRAGVGERNRVALSFLDDATRFGLDIRAARSENTVDFLKLLFEMVRQCGRPSRCFFDGGPEFVSDDTKTVLARLGIGFIYGTAGYPEGHGKIERYNRTLRDQVLRGLRGNPDVDADPAALTLRLRHWMTEVYNHSPHEGLDGETPFSRFHRDPRPLDFPTPGWERQFVLTFSRRASADNLVSVDGIDFELPLGHARRLVELTWNVLDESVRILHDGELVRLAPVDRVKNAYERRAPRRRDRKNEPAAPVETAAQAAWDRDYRPLTDAEGGYTDPGDDSRGGDPDDDRNGGRSDSQTDSEGDDRSLVRKPENDTERGDPDDSTNDD